MKTSLWIAAALFLICPAANSQDDAALFSRVRAISNSGTDFYNVDGIEITSQVLEGDFSKKNIQKKFRRYSIKENDLNTSDSTLGMPNFYVSKSEEAAPGATQYTSYYFVQDPNKKITAITFGSINKNNRDFERHFVKLVTSNGLPKDIYEPLKIDSINFAGRKISLGSSCQWMGINNVQCPYYGQMNWSVHETLEDAANSVKNQYALIKAKRNGKIVAEDTVAVTFEGNETKAKKIIFDLKGVSSLLAGMSGGKTLTVYFVAAPGKQNFVSCVMSFWNNDNINPSGLPPLLEQVMKLNK